MKIYLLNDTSKHVHAGSDAVMRNIESQLQDHNIIARHRVGEMSIEDAAVEAADWLIVNGEGTIHHNQPVGTFLLDCLKMAQQRGKKTALINTIYQEMDERHRDTLRNLDLFTVRDPLSLNSAKAFGADPILLIDMCVDANFINRGVAAGNFGICKGGAHRTATLKNYFFTTATKKILRKLPFPMLPLRGNFEDIVATLRASTLYITGQYHGVYAAGLAGTPFVCFPSNSHKIEALLQWSQLPIPVCSSKQLISRQIDWATKNAGAFRDFKEFLLSQPAHSRTFFNSRIN